MVPTNDQSPEETKIDLVVIQDLIERIWHRRSGYRGLDLVHSMRSGYSTGSAPTNFSTHTLWNNTKQGHLLVVRDVRPSMGSGVAGSAYVTTPGGSSLGGVTHILPDHGVGPGLHYYQDTSSAITFDYILGYQSNTSWWAYDYPFAVLPPGFGLAIQNSTSAANMKVGFLWEYVLSSELEEWLKL